MSSNAPTLPPSPDANGDPLKTNLDLRQVVVDAVREVVRQEVLPRFAVLETRVEGMEIRLGGVETELRKVNKKLDVLNQSILEIRADQRLLEDRIELLEKGSV